MLALLLGALLVAGEPQAMNAQLANLLQFGRECGRAEVLMAWAESTATPEMADRLQAVRRDFQELVETPEGGGTPSQNQIESVRAMNVLLLGLIEVQLAGSSRAGAAPKELRDLKERLMGEEDSRGQKK